MGCSNTSNLCYKESNPVAYVGQPCSTGFLFPSRMNSMTMHRWPKTLSFRTPNFSQGLAIRLFSFSRPINAVVPLQLCKLFELQMWSKIFSHSPNYELLCPMKICGQMLIGRISKNITLRTKINSRNSGFLSVSKRYAFV